MAHGFRQLTAVDHPLVQHKMAELRDEKTPTSRFRQLVNEVTTLIMYEATWKMPLVEKEVKTPVNIAHCKVLADDEPVIVPILRAGLGMVDSAIDYLNAAKVGHLGMYRNEETHMPVPYYHNLPKDIEKRQVFVVDPMLATGGSAIEAIDYLKENGAKDFTFVCIVAARDGVKALLDAHPDITVVAAAFDEKLTKKAYIDPGLGDAGDRIYGTMG